MKKANHHDMVDLVKNIEKEVETFINEFSDKFYGKFGIRPMVTYSSKVNLIGTNLIDLENVANYCIYRDLDIDITGASIKTRTRQRTLVIYRQCIFKMARDLGYGLARIGHHFGYDHATVLYATRNITNLVTCKDKQVIKILNKLQNELEKRYRNDGAAPSDSETKIDT